MSLWVVFEMIPAVGSNPVAVSEDRVMFAGQDHHLYHISVKDKVGSKSETAHYCS
jgi:hypothetical protein